MKQTEDLNAQLVRRSPAGIAVFQDRRHVFVNSAYASLLGYSVDALQGMDQDQLRCLIHPEDRERVYQEVTQGIAEQTAPRQMDLRLLTRAGATVWVEGHSSAVQYRGRPARQLFVMDITSRKRAQEELNRLSIAVHQSTDGFAVADAEGRLEFVNPAWAEMHGYSAHELVGEHLSISHTEEQMRTDVTPFNEAVRQAGYHHGDVGHVRRDGTTFPTLMSTTLLKDADGNLAGLVGMARDITERKRAQQERQDLEAQLQHAQKLESLGVLAGGIAHDFNNLLTVLWGNLQILGDSSALPPEDREMVEESTEACRRAKSLTSQLLTFARGGVPIKRAGSMGDLTRSCVEFSLRGSNVQHAVVIPDDLWIVNVDEGQMSQVIQNLAINADQAMPDGGQLRIEASNVVLGEADKGDISLLAEGDYVSITFEDQGTGILAEHLTKIFDPYFSTKQKGRGLGLAISHSIVKNHGGLLRVNAKVSRGSVFEIILPASEPAREQEAAQAPAQVLGTGRLLVMDDEPPVRKIAALVLERLGFEVDLAADGEHAVALFREAREAGSGHDAVILDLTVPGAMGGIKAAAELKKIDPEVVAIVSSGYSNDPVMSNHQEYGFQGVIAKPYSIDEMRQLLNEILGRDG